MKTTVCFHYGIAAPTLKKQAAEQGFCLIDPNGNLQKGVDAMNRLYFNDFLTDAERQKVVARIHREAVKAVRLAPIKSTEANHADN